jgi:hypothetical protein
MIRRNYAKFFQEFKTRILEKKQLKHWYNSTNKFMVGSKN